ncbi:E3 ubiquitin-protein ligase rnf8-B-like [Papaver somniferum]|uniref:E3 ubiquitin-protein ligase rnf8-B-like n=1 Tax=Papaver somniferum TaxID=3469 RepID=UPI000E7032B2|nr:E3 ubiquitin-protein ligase rnf8-B-like [Papaver somniferum]
MATEEFQSPQNHKNVVHRDIIISPRFRSVAAMAGWDEEALLAASVEDTPERESSKRQKRTNLASKSPQTNSRSITGNTGFKDILLLMLKQELHAMTGPLLAKGRIICAICLEICFEPSTTPCGHSFCKKCLKSAADKCRKKCPKCRQLIGNGRSCIVNTSVWNTIQLLFPREVEARKAVAPKNSRGVKDQSTLGEDSISRSRSGRTNSMVMMTDRSNIRVSSSSRNQSGRSDFMGMNREDSVRLSSSERMRSNIRVSSSSRNQSGRSDFMGMNREDSVSLSSSERIRGARPNQAEDAALALRLQREEFMVAFRAADEPQQSASSTSRSLNCQSKP